MQRFVMTTAALVLGLVVSGSLYAGGHPGGGHPGSHGHSGSKVVAQHAGSHGKVGHVQQHAQGHGQKFAHGYYYTGKNHNHWSQRLWNTRYGCYTYYDSGYSCWYYWCQPDNCYYPVSYCPYGVYYWAA